MNVFVVVFVFWPAVGSGHFGLKNAKKVVPLTYSCTSSNFNICNTSHAKLMFLHIRQARIFIISAIHLKKASKKLTIISTMFWRVPGRLRSASMALLRCLTNALGAPSSPFLQHLPCNIAVFYSLKKTPITAPGRPQGRSRSLQGPQMNPNRDTIGAPQGAESSSRVGETHVFLANHQKHTVKPPF